MAYKNYSTPRTTSPFRNKGFILAGTMAAVIMVLTLVGVGFSVFQSAGVSSSVTSCTVTGKDRTSNHDGGSDMRIYAEGCDGVSTTRVFTVADNVFTGQFASADVFANIKIGKTYNFQLRGSRIPVISMLQNIVGVTEVAK